MTSAAIRRIDLGYFVRPELETGTGQPRVEPVLGYVVKSGNGTIVFDTGLAVADPETEAHYRPRRRSLLDALARADLEPADISVVVNCHLHFDHCGGNSRFAGRPILTQTAEMAAARGAGYTMPSLIDFPGARYEEVDGEVEIWPGVWIIPTPGHTPGHQSLVVRQPDGTVVLAGQAHDFASEFASDQLTRRAVRAGEPPPLPAYKPWLDRLAEFDPRRVLFAHDHAVWEP